MQESNVSMAVATLCPRTMGLGLGSGGIGVPPLEVGPVRIASPFLALVQPVCRSGQNLVSGEFSKLMTELRDGSRMHCIPGPTIRYI